MKTSTKLYIKWLESHVPKEAFDSFTDGLNKLVSIKPLERPTGKIFIFEHVTTESKYNANIYL